MATLLLTAVGTAFGGPIGGAIGGLIGRQLDHSIFGGGSQQGPRLKELSVTTSSYGQPIPRQFGRMRVSGTVIWSTDLVETSNKEGGGKGRPSTTTYSYSSSFAVSLSSTPIAEIGRIWADGNLLRGAAGDLKVEGAMRAYLGHGDDPVDPLIAAHQGAHAPAFRDCAYVVFEDLSLADFGNRIPALTFEIVGLQDAHVSLADLVPQSSASPDDSELEQARGFADEGGPLASTLSAIERVFPLTCSVQQNGFALSSRTSLPAAIPTLPEQLSRQNDDDAGELFKRRADAIEREPLALRYYDEDRDYQPSVQRAVGSRGDGREQMVDLPVTLTAGGAKELANANAHRSRWQNERITWHQGELDHTIRPGSIVKVPETPGLWLVKAWEWYNRGIELGLERVPPTYGQSVGGDPGIATPAKDIELAASDLVAIEVPADGLSNPATPQLFAAASSSSEGWRGAALYVEQGATLVPVGNANSRRAVIGTLVEPADPSTSHLFEPNAQIVVELNANDLSLDEVDINGIANGANRLAIDNEVLQFASAAPLGDRRWRLSGLLRGRAGTESSAVAGHAAGSTVVLLDERLTPLDPALVASDEATRIAAVGRGDSEPVYAGLINSGLSRKPLTPVHPMMEIRSDGSLIFCWTRRARGQWRWENAAQVPLVEEQELYTLGFGSTTSPLATWTVSQARFELSSTEHDSLVAEHGASSLWVMQVGTYATSAPLRLAEIS